MLTIKGIRLTAVNLTRNKDNGQMEITGSYQLISSADTVLATQSINGYSDFKYAPGITAQKALNEFIETFTAEIGAQLGFVTP